MTIYYVDNSTVVPPGGGGPWHGLPLSKWLGRSPYQPWKYTAQVNAASLQPGDYVLFRRGRTWRGSWLVVPSSGTAGNRITFGTYGEGANPVIDPCLEYNDFTLDAGAIWERSSNDNPEQVFEDDVRLAKADSYVAMVEGSWFWEGWPPDPPVLYVWSSDSGNPNTDHVTEHPATWRWAIDLNGQSYVDFNGIDAIRSALAGYGFQFVAGSTDITIRDAVAGWNRARGFDIGGYAVLGVDNIRFYNCIGHDVASGEGFWVGNGANILVSGCETYNCTGILSGIRSVDVVIEDCYVHGITLDTGIMDEFEPGYARPTGTIIRRCHVVGDVITNGTPVVFIEGEDTLVENNIIETTYTHGIQVADGADGVEIYHNTIYCPGVFYGIAIVDGADVKEKNNLVIASKFIHAGAAGQGGYDSDYNDYYSTATEEWFWENGVPPFAFNLADWRTVSGQDANALNVDPVVVTPGSDFHLQVTSPCRGGGVNVGVTHDYDGVARGDPPDIGAYEYVAP